MTGPLDFAIRIAELLDDLGIPYVIGGSIASSLVGEPRATVDIDLAVKMSPSAADAVIAAFSDEFYIDEEAIREAVREHRAFNVIHLPSMQKADIFVLGDTLLDRRQIERRRRLIVLESPRTELWVGSTEDQVLRKLSWFRQGGEISDRQWA